MTHLAFVYIVWRKVRAILWQSIGVFLDFNVVELGNALYADSSQDGLAWDTWNTI